MDGSYDISLVVLSVIIAIFASYSALNIVHRVIHHLKRFKLFWIIIGSCVEGLGIWIMHFVGMLAHTLPFPVKYDTTLLVISMLLPIISAFIALWIVTRGSHTLLTKVIGGLFMSSAIAGMHYTGMAAMVIPATIQYDLFLVLVSIAIAVVISFAALYFYFQSTSRQMSSWERLIAGGLLGIAVAGMHYTGMAAADYVTGAPANTPIGDGKISAATHFTLVVWVSVAALCMLLLILLSQTIERNIMIRVAKRGERRYYFIFERSPDIVCLFDMNGNLLQVNPAGRTITGYSEQELRQVKPLELIDPAVRKRIRTLFKRAATGVSQTIELTFRHKKGQLLYLNTTMIPLIVGGKIIDIYTISQDITERKRAENELKKNEARLAETQQIAHIGSWDYNKLTNEYKWSEGLYHIMDVPVHHSPLRRAEIVKLVYPYDLLEFERHIDLALNHNEMGRFEFRMVRADGTLKYCYGEYCTELGFNGEALRKYGYMQDITERRQLELQLREATQAKSRFLSGVIHEIRTQLNAIVGLSHLLQRTELSKKQQDYMGIIQSASRSIRSIINNNLDYSKIESGVLELEECAFMLHDVLKDVADVVALRAAEKKLELYFYHTPEIPSSLLGDPMRLGQVLTNLVDNAVKFTESGEIILRARLESQTAETVTLHFSVKDVGIGITKEQQQYLFQPFVQAEPSTSRKYGGTGLGLPISQQLIRQMNGEITVESSPEEGSEFSFTADFRLSASQDSQAPAVSDEARESLRQRGQGLLIHDSDTFVQMVGQTLLDNGYTFLDAIVDQEVIGKLDKAAHSSDSNVDFIIMDWAAGDVQWPESRNSIVQWANNNRIPIICVIDCLEWDQLNGLSGSASSELNYIMQKPFLNAELMRLMDQLPIGKDYVYEEQLKAAHAADSSPDNSNEVRILVVEDLEMNKVIMQELLKPYFTNIDWAENGMQAIDKLANASESPYDLILMDLYMPELDGYETTRVIRQYDQALPVIAVSANAFIWERQKCQEAGIDDYIGKPIDPQQLIQTVTSWIRLGQRRRVSMQMARPTLVNRGEELPAEEQLETERLLDTDALLERLGGNKSVLNHIYQIFIREQTNLIPSLKRSAAEGDIGAMKLQLHNLRGAASNLSIDKLAATAGQLEEVIKSGDLSDIVKRMDQLVRLIDRVLQQLTELLEHQDPYVATNGM